MLEPSTPRTILVAQDKGETNQHIRNDLQRSGYQTTVVHTLKDAINSYLTLHPQMVIIDTHLSGGGLKCCGLLRKEGATIPLLLLTNQESLNDRVACLDAGADDYILSPYQRDLFLHRIRLYLEPHNLPDTNQLTFDNLSLNLSNRSAQRNNRNIELTMKEFDLLKFLMEHPRETLGREQILETVWGFDYLGESNVIEVYIRYLRLKLEEDGSTRLIHTVRGVGYVLREN